MTSQYDAVASVCVKSTQQDDEGGTSTNDEGIGEDAQTLQQPLIDGMRYGGCGSGIGGATFTCFVREESALHTLHHSYSYGSSCSLFPSESTTDDEA